MKFDRSPRLRLPKNCIGMYTALEFSMEFLDWTATLHGEPTPKLIQQRFSVCRATAYRWIAAYRAFKQRREVAA